ncbi:NUDIX hydrolase [Hoyosella altamirensis]|uniref:RimJ/RimL family protein N-acetyltransferase/ADP-ribose pyrophosphatase YjhB (NUDIX family) n=1 Tax=Hoyosella altamirensis TaxID=616997 RepID=A0A839RL42_9ACTN|nr:GNAT family N-acetyltransferase [Hoyosella altamirensis]MBB3037190.1 RimJ/RimL family protein N-acetyltransferase/ADP-ribose pyrophosphatase YjhB (NUDIX family) [Hoyosella altamirensis]
MGRRPTDNSESARTPVLTDGVVTLRPWNDADIPAAERGHDEEIRRWTDAQSANTLTKAVKRGREKPDPERGVSLVIEHDGIAVGYVEVRRTTDDTGELYWVLFAGQRGRGLATRALALLAEYAFDELGFARIEAHVDVENLRSIRLATRAGLRREGLLRKGRRQGKERRDTVVLARLADDPPLRDPGGFREILNAFLPRKRAISQMLIRDDADRVLLCELTYKRDWDLPGGVVEVGESPFLAVSRELQEELGLDVPAGRLLLTDWLPPWGGWDDAVCLVFDGGAHPSSLLDTMVADAKEVRTAEFCTVEEVRARCTDFTARRIESALHSLEGGGPQYTESGRP